MTGRAKIEAALSPQGSPQTPAVICYEGIYVRDHWDQLTDCPWWYHVSPDLEQQLAWRRDVLAATGQDWFALPACPPRAQREATTIDVVGDRVTRRCGSAVEALTKPVIGGWDPKRISHQGAEVELPQTRAQVDAAVPPVEPVDARQFVAEGCADLAEAMLSEYGRELYPIVHVSSPLWNCYSLWGFEGMMLMVADRPDLVRRACDRLLARSIASVQRAAALGAAGIWIEECMTDMVSPAAFAELNVPVMQQLVEAIRASGLASIYYYCGDPTDRWDALLSIGADALSLEESKKGFAIDIDDVVRHVDGRCAVLGNLDAMHLLEHGSDDVLAAEIARQIQAGRRNGRRFVMSIGSPVTPGTPVARVRGYCDMVHELGNSMRP